MVGVVLLLHMYMYKLFNPAREVVSRMRVRRTMIAMGVVALSVVFVLPALAWEPTMQGYAQFRWEYSDLEDDGDFDTRRVRLSWKDTVNEQGTMARVQLDVGDLFEGGGHEIDLKDAWLSHPFSSGWTTRVGFGDAEFGLDNVYSSSSRLPFERSKANREFLPGEKALGVLFTYENPEVTPVVVDLQYADGMDSWADDDDDSESFISRVQLPLDNDGLVGVSYMASTREGDGYDVDPDLWGAHVRYNGTDRLAGFAFQGEYYDGEFYDGAPYDADGWYGLLEYQPAESDSTLFYRYDELDGAAGGMQATQAGSGIDFERHTLGVAWDFMDSNRLTLQVEDIEDGDSYTTFGVQWQVMYR